MLKITLITILLFCQSSLAQDPEIDALLETQKLMRDPKRLQKEALTNKNAIKADEMAQLMTLNNPELKKELYGISAELLPWVVQLSGGDPVKMQELLLESQKNPTAFYKRIPATAREKIKSLANKIESKKQAGKTP